MAQPRAACGFLAGRAVDLAVESPVMQNMHRHVCKLLAAVGVALMAYAWADEERFNQAELFCLGAGVAPAGVLFWRDPPGPHAPR